jgi:Tol biopolymer transport system component
MPEPTNDIPPEDEETAPTGRQVNLPSTRPAAEDEPTLPGGTSRREMAEPTLRRLPSVPEDESEVTSPSQRLQKLPIISFDDDDDEPEPFEEPEVPPAQAAPDSGAAPAIRVTLPDDVVAKKPPAEPSLPPDILTPAGLRPIPDREDQPAEAAEPTEPPSPPAARTMGESPSSVTSVSRSTPPPERRPPLPEDPRTGLLPFMKPVKEKDQPDQKPEPSADRPRKSSRPPTASSPFPDLSREGTQAADAPDIVDAEWVVDVERKQAEVGAPNLWTTFGQLPVVIVNRWGPWRVLGVLVVMIILALLIFVPAAFNADNRPPKISGSGSATATPDVGAGAKPTATTPAYARGRIVFASNRDGDFELYIFDLESNALTQLTYNDVTDHEPSWSPDGTKLVFVSDWAGDDDLYTLDLSCLDTGDHQTCETSRVQLTTGADQDRSPSWSPDGSTIVFSRETVAGSSLQSFRTDCLAEPGACENNLRPVTGEQYFRLPTWSPTGGRLAFTAADFPGLPSAIALISPDGSTYKPLEGTGATDTDPDWSPDGTWITFVSNVSVDLNLWLMSTSGEGAFQLTANPADDVEPAWSPDGAYIVFASDRGTGNDFELYLIPATCSSIDQGCEDRLITITDNLADDLNPDWIR